MSMRLIDLAKQLLSSEISAPDFELQYLAAWREEGNSGTLSQDPVTMGQCASELFILADCYTSDSDRDDYELDEDGLKREIEVTLKKFNFL